MVGKEVSMIVSWNEQLVAEEDVRVSVRSAMLLRGEGVFETLRVKQGQVMYWADHAERLANGAERLGFKMPTSLEEGIGKVAEANGLGDARMRITLGEDVLVTASELEESSESLTAVTSEVFPINEKGLLAGVKCCSYAENMMLLRSVEAEEVLRQNTRGELCEGCVSNIFFVLKGQICTPSLEVGCLPGVMRKQVIRTVNVEEGLWPIAVLQEAEEVWVSNATKKLRFVRELDGRLMGEPSGLLRKVNEMIS